VHCHEKNVVHGDIAARNFLVSKELNAFICDFGMSRELTAGQNFVKGSLEDQVPVKWSAPEVLSDRIYSFKSDVYAFGMFLVEVVSLGEPWAGEHLSNRVIGDCIVDPQSPRHRPNIPGYCPKQLANLMRGCWADDVKKRPTAKDISQVLDQFHRNCADATVDDLARIYDPENPAQVPRTLPTQPHQTSTSSVSNNSNSHSNGSHDDARYGSYMATDGGAHAVSPTATIISNSSNSGNSDEGDDSRYEVYRVHHTPSLSGRGVGGFIELQTV